MKLATITFAASALLLDNVVGHAIKRGTSTTASASSATPVKNSGKRGLAYNVDSLTKFFSLSGQDSQVSWAYNWGQTRDASNFNSALEYVPMLWSNASDLTNTWAVNAQAAIDSGSTALLAFNEPDLCVSGSSCMDIPSAVAAYKKYMQPFAGKALLGSPAVTNGGAPLGLDWLSHFIGNCTGCTIDFINIHWYSNHWAGVSYLQYQVEAARAMAGGRPIWITEFALTDGTDADVQSFIEDAVLYLDEQDDVARYAYFMDTAGILVNSAGTGLSTDGAIYNNYTQVSSASSSSSFSSSLATSSSTSSAGSLSTYTTSRIATSSSSSSSSTAVITSTSSTKQSSSSTKSSSTSTKSSSSTSSTTTKASTTTSLTKASTSTSTKTSTTVTAATTTPSSLKILSAYFADKDVTTTAQTAFISGSNIVINTNTLLSTLSISDPWWGTVKTLSVLYTLGNTTHIFTAVEQTGTYTLTPSTVTTASTTPGYAVTNGADITVVGVVWGNTQISTQSVYNTLYRQEASGWGFQISTALFGVDGFWGHEKSAIVWYRNGQGVLKALVGREGGWVKF